MIDQSDYKVLDYNEFEFGCGTTELATIESMSNKIE